MRKSELEQYARENRKRLETQDVKLGDVVKVLVGQFAGEQGVIVGINAYDNDFADPYYEVNMYCEVPDKYKCRKTLLTPYNVIGGVSAYEFEVVGNRVPKQPTEEIKCGDKVHVIRSANLTPASGIDLFRRNISLVTRIKDGMASLYIIDEYGLNHYAKAPIEDLVKVFKDESDKDKPHDNTITIPVKVDLDDTYWDAYKAELASKIAVAYAEKGRFAPDEIGGFAVRVANDVVDNLKKQSDAE